MNKLDYEKARVLFETLCGTVKHTTWCGTGYAPTLYNAWDANAYCDKFRGFLVLYNSIVNDIVDPYLMEIIE